jgi:subtilisin family serine protease
VRRTRFALVGALLGALAIAAPVGAASPRAYDGAASDGKAAPARATVDRAYALVQLVGEPLSTYAKTKPAQGKKVDFASTTVKSYKALLAARRNDFKSWLQKVAPKAQVVKGYDLALNAVSVKLNGTSLATIRTSALVVRAEYQGLYYPLDVNDPDLGLINAFDAWTAAGGSAANAGEGVKVAVVDSGIDASHPCFADAGYPARTQLGDRRFTNNKVIVAKVFNMKAVSRGYTAEAIDSHGTHVSGTIACNLDTPATVGGATIPYGVSGVAPRALLGNYNVFPSTVENARSEDILNALEAAYVDGMDVANMSLGGGAHGIQDLLSMGVDNLDRANMVVAVAAGNSGPGLYTIESPGSAARALTAGGITVGHFVASPLTVGGTVYPAVLGDFNSVAADLTAPLAVVTVPPVNAVSGLAEACSALPAGSLTGKIALIGRGTCDFSTKIRYAELAGAIAVIVGNRVPGDAVAMAQGASPDGIQPTVPAYSTSLDAALALKAKDGMMATIGATPAYFTSPYSNLMYSSSSQGPTDVDFRVKPDVVAPAVNVLSSIPVSYCDGDPCFAFFQGTSMATPHLAGAAAIVRQQHPDWPAWAVRSAVVNTADVGIVKKATDPAALETDVNVSAAGRLNLGEAVRAEVVLDPVSVSFGAVPSGSGVTRTFAVRVLNPGPAARTLAFSIAPYGTSTGVAFSVASAPLTVAAGGTATVTVTATFAKAAPAGHKQAWLVVSEGGSMVAHAAVYALVK